MSKQTEAKINQGFRKTPYTCSNCAHFSSQSSTNTYGWVGEKQLRCLIGGFKVGKTNVCNKHELKAHINKLEVAN